MNSYVELIGREWPEKAIYEILAPIKLLHMNFDLTRLGFDIEQRPARRQQIVYNNITIALIPVGGPALLDFWVTSRLLNPLKEPVSLASEIAGGNIQASANIDSGDEIEELSNSLTRWRVSYKK